LEAENNKYKEELENYKKKEALEFQQKKESMTNELIELYSDLGIEKSTDNFKDHTMNHLIELRSILEQTVQKKNTSVREAVVPKQQVKKQDNSSVELSDSTVFESLFGQGYYDY